ncbi:MAG: hypothetical protein ACTTJS_06055 [Wolinella sp.]
MGRISVRQPKWYGGIARFFGGFLLHTLDGMKSIGYKGCLRVYLICRKCC